MLFHDFERIWKIPLLYSIKSLVKIKMSNFNIFLELHVWNYWGSRTKKTFQDRFRKICSNFALIELFLLKFLGFDKPKHQDDGVKSTTVNNLEMLKVAFLMLEIAFLINQS